MLTEQCNTFYTDILYLSELLLYSGYYIYSVCSIYFFANCFAWDQRTIAYSCIYFRFDGIDICNSVKVFSNNVARNNKPFENFLCLLHCAHDK